MISSLTAILLDPIKEYICSKAQEAVRKASSKIHEKAIDEAPKQGMSVGWMRALHTVASKVNELQSSLDALREAHFKRSIDYINQAGHCDDNSEMQIDFINKAFDDALLAKNTVSDVSMQIECLALLLMTGFYKFSDGGKALEKGLSFLCRTLIRDFRNNKDMQLAIQISGQASLMLSSREERILKTVVDFTFHINRVYCSLLKALNIDGATRVVACAYDDLDQIQSRLLCGILMGSVNSYPLVPLKPNEQHFERGTIQSFPLEYVLPFIEFTWSAKALSYIKSYSAIVIESLRGELQCCSCYELFFESSNHPGSCSSNHTPHSLSWHATFEDCWNTKVKCAWGLGTKIGSQHWGCCFGSDKKIQDCSLKKHVSLKNDFYDIMNGNNGIQTDQSVDLSKLKYVLPAAITTDPVVATDVYRSFLLEDGEDDIDMNE